MNKTKKIKAFYLPKPGAYHVHSNENEYGNISKANLDTILCAEQLLLYMTKDTFINMINHKTSGRCDAGRIKKYI